MNDSVEKGKTKQEEEEKSRQIMRRSITACQGMCTLTFTQFSEDQELCLSGVRLLLTDGSRRAELNHVGMTRELFLQSRQVKDQSARTLP